MYSKNYKIILPSWKYTFFEYIKLSLYRLGSCPMLSSNNSMTQTELLQELTNDCRYDKMARPLGEDNVTDPIKVYTRAYIYTIKSNMAKTLVA